MFAGKGSKQELREAWTRVNGYLTTSVVSGMVGLSAGIVTAIITELKKTREYYNGANERILFAKETVDNTTAAVNAEIMKVQDLKSATESTKTILDIVKFKEEIDLACDGLIKECEDYIKRHGGQ